MTYQETVKYLRKYKKLSFDLIDYRNRMTGLKSITYSDEPKASARTDTNPLDTYISQIEAITSEMELIRKNVQDNLENGHRLIIWHEYVEDKTLEEISEMIGYSLEWVKLHRRLAIEELAERLH